MALASLSNEDDGNQPEKWLSAGNTLERKGPYLSVSSADLLRTRPWQEQGRMVFYTPKNPIEFEAVAEHFAENGIALVQEGFEPGAIAVQREDMEWLLPGFQVEKKPRVIVTEVEPVTSGGKHKTLVPEGRHLERFTGTRLPSSVVATLSWSGDESAPVYTYCPPQKLAAVMAELNERHVTILTKSPDNTLLTVKRAEFEAQYPMIQIHQGITR